MRDGDGRLMRFLMPRPATTNVPAPFARGLTKGGEIVLERRGLGLLAGRIVPVAGIAITAYMLKDDIRALIEGDPDMWPGLKEIFYNPGNYTELNQFSQSGVSYSTPYGDKTVTAIASGGTCMTWEPWCAGIPPWTCLETTNGQCSKVEYAWESGSNQKSWKDFYVQVAPTPIPRPATDSEIITTSTADSGAMSDQASEDLEKLMADNPEKVYTDSPVVTPLEEKASQDEQAAQDEADTARDNAIQQLEDKCAIDGPGSQSCIDLERLKAEKAKEEAERARRIIQEQQKEEDEEMPSNDSAELKSLNFDKWKDLKGTLENTWPFTLLLGIPDKIGQLIDSEPHAPVLTAHIYGDKKATVDLSIFDPVAAVCRWMIKLLMSIGVIWVLVNWWRGVSNG